MTTQHLTPAQEQAFQWLLGAIPAADVLVLRGRAGAGKSTILTRVHAARGGILLQMRPLMRSLASHQVEDALLRTIERALESANLVIVDDLHMITGMVGRRDYSRTLLLDAALTSILAEASVARKKLVFSLDGNAPWPIRRRACSAEIAD
jgi:ABC-type branched-subunit amino acid transport system ATPase component